MRILCVLRLAMKLSGVMEQSYSNHRSNVIDFVCFFAWMKILSCFSPLHH